MVLFVEQSEVGVLFLVSKVLDWAELDWSVVPDWRVDGGREVCEILRLFLLGCASWVIDGE